MAPPRAPAALQDARALVLGDHALDLQEQVVLGRAADGAVEERHSDAGVAEILDEHLVGVASRQAVGGEHVDQVHLARRDRVAQRLQHRARQCRPAAVLVQAWYRPTAAPSAAARSRRAATWFATVLSRAWPSLDSTPSRAPACAAASTTRHLRISRWQRLTLRWFYTKIDAI